LAALAAAGSGCDGGSPVPPSTPAYTLTAEQLQGEYEANELAAEAKYKNKCVEVTGVVSEIGREIFTKEAYLVLGAMRVRCVFPSETESGVAGVAIGRKVEVTGVVIQKYGMFVLLKSCRLSRETVAGGGIGVTSFSP
jgi:hypothetical protein